MSGLRFCFLTTFYPPYNLGGDGISVQRLARGLVRAGHHVTVVHDVDAYTALAKNPVPEATPEPPGLEVLSLRSGIGALSALLTQQAGRPVQNRRKISRLLSDGAYDVINFHNVSLIGGPGLLKYGRAVKVYMAHEHWLVCPTHVLWRYGRELCPGRECLRCQISYRRPPQLWRATGFLERQLHHIDLFIAMSEFSREKHREFGFSRPMAVLPCFLPPSDEVPASGGGERPHARPYFLFVGRLERIKGVQDILPEFAGDGDTDLLIAGEGEFGSALREQAATMPRVHFLGRVASEALGPYYAHAIALIVPSICFETFGIILIEAFRQSTPVIARRLGPFTEIIEASGGGALFSNRRELSVAMTRLSTDRAYRDATAAAAHTSFGERWREDVVVPHYLALIRDVAQQKGDTRVANLLRAGRCA